MDHKIGDIMFDYRWVCKSLEATDFYFDICFNDIAWPTIVQNVCMTKVCKTCDLHYGYVK